MKAEENNSTPVHLVSAFGYKYTALPCSTEAFQSLPLFYPGTPSALITLAALATMAA